MKTLIMIFLTLSVVGCATNAPISYQEHCALRGLTLAGVSDGTSSAVAMGNNGNYAVARGNSESVSCVVPKTPEEKCEANRLTTVAAPKVDYNSNLTGKHWINGLAYVAYILPGVGAKLYYDHQLDKAVAESKELDQKTINACTAPNHPSPSAPEAKPADAPAQKMSKAE